MSAIAVQNSIVVVKGANFDLSVQEFMLARDIVTRIRVLLCQLEVPQPVVHAALEIARVNGGFLYVFLLLCINIAVLLCCTFRASQ